MPQLARLALCEYWDNAVLDHVMVSCLLPSHHLRDLIETVRHVQEQLQPEEDAEKAASVDGDDEDEEKGASQASEQRFSDCSQRSTTSGGQQCSQRRSIAS